MSHVFWGKASAILLQRPVLTLSFLCCLLFLPGIASMPPLDRDESRYAQATSQMLETGDYIDIRFQDAPRYKKPVGIYWMQAIAVSLVSDVSERAIWAYRLPSFFGAVLAVLMTFWGTRRLCDQRTAFIAAALLASCVVLMAESTIAKTDAFLVGCVVTAQMALAQIYNGARGGAQTLHFTLPGPTAFLFWIATGLGILIKGPVILMVTGLTLITLLVADRDAAWLRRIQLLPGLMILALILLPWSSAIWQLTDGAFFTKSLGGDLGSKVVSGQESHGAPPGYFTVLSMVGFWPGSLILIPALWWAWTKRADTAIRFCLAWLIPSWIVFELIPTKLPHYTLPLFPALAILCAAFLNNLIEKNAQAVSILKSKAALIGLGIWGLVAVIFAGLGSIYPLTIGVSLSPLLVLISLLSVVFSALGVWFLWRTSAPFKSVTALLCASLCVVGGLRAFTIPSIPALNVSSRLAEAVKRHQDFPSPALASSGYTEPSLVFLLGTDTKLVAPAGAARYISTTEDSIAIIESRKEDAFHTALEKMNTQVTALEQLSGLNYSNGKEVHLTLYRVTP